MIKLKASKSSISSKRLEQALKRYQAELEQRAAETELELAEEILKVACEKAPKDTMELVESGYIKKAKKMNVGFRAKHAQLVHEQPQSMRKTGERHYLSNAIKEVVGKDGQGIRKRLGRFGGKNK